MSIPEFPDFQPAWWLPGAHAQTIGGRYARSHKGVRFTVERIETPDADFLDLEYSEVAGSAPAGPGAPLALMLHGLEGSAHSAYAAELARALAPWGIRSVGLNFRSCGGPMNLTARFYHSGETLDLAQVVDHLHNRFPDAPLLMIGFSLGGNVLLKYLGERGPGVDPAIKAAVAISVPYDLEASARRIDAGTARMYARFFLHSLKQKVLAKRALIEPLCDIEAALKATTVHEFDQALTAPVHGFASATEYYADSSAGPWLGAIRVPVLLIHAADDPVAPGTHVPHDLIAANPRLALAYPANGGHVGFVTGTGPLHPRFWAEESAAAFVAGRT